MGLFGKLLALPVRIVNAPIRAAEDFMGGDDHTLESDRFFSKPLDLLSDQIERVDGDGDDEKPRNRRRSK